MTEESYETNKYHSDVSHSTNDTKFGNLDMRGVDEKKIKNNLDIVLTWSPEFDESKLDAILEKFQIHPMLSDLCEKRESVFGFDKLVISTDTHPSIKSNITDDIISKQEMLQIIYDSNFDEEAIRKVLEERNVKGWNERYHMCPLWDLNDVQRFEMAMDLYYKKFHKIGELLPNKTVKEIIEFYYFWKQMPRYKEWMSLYKKNNEQTVRSNHNTQYLKVKEDFEHDGFLKTDPLLELGFLENLDPFLTCTFDIELCSKKRKREDQMSDSLKCIFDLETVPLNA